MVRRNRPRRKRPLPKKNVEWKELGFRSSFEHEGAKDLDSRGVSYKFEPHQLEYTYTETRKYTPDFKLEGLPFYLEFKGWFSPSDRKKAIRVRESNPDVDIRFVFQKPNNPIRKGSETTYAKWCDKNGFLWADRYVPQAWLEEIHSDRS